MSVTMRTYYTLRKALFYPKDKVEKENTCGVVYEILCHNCEMRYIDKMDRKLKTRLSDYEKDAKTIRQGYTR